MDNGANSYRRYLAGDESGIVEIIRDYKDGLLLYLNGFTQNIHTAEDLMEDTFVKLVVKKPRFSNRSTFKTWLYSIGRNIAIDYLRHHSKSVPASDAELQNMASEMQDLEQSYIQEEEKRILHRALGRLKPEYRQVLYLSFFEDFCNAQIAVVMRKTKRQVENLLYRAKRSLKSELEKEHFIYEGL